MSPKRRTELREAEREGSNSSRKKAVRAPPGRRKNGVRVSTQVILRESGYAIVRENGYDTLRQGGYVILRERG
jgi:hypothetical protein